MNAISLSQVSKSYGNVQAVSGLGLEVPVGQSLALLGPNGAGKSTTVSMLLGLTRPDGGEIKIFGESPEDAVRHGLIGAMRQEGSLPAGLTVKEVVAFVRGIYPDPMPLADILEIADLKDLVKRRADQLSGGQTQRVCFALAIAGAPKLLVLDEPTAAMDVESRRSFWASMRDYTAGGRTILFATHYLEEADESADRIVLIAGGRTVADGTPAQIKSMAGGRNVRFDLAGQPAAGLDLLPGVTAVEIRGESVLLRTTDSDATAEALFKVGRRVRNLEISGAGLEDAFLSLTK